MVDRKQVFYKGTVPFEISTIPAQTAFFVLGVRKSGSSIFNSMVRALALKNGLNFVDVGGTLFERGFAVADWQNDPSLAEILANGNIYGGFRNSPKGIYKNEMFQKGRKVLMVRDPRDALVSEYFSNAYSHSVPQGGESRTGLLKLRQLALELSIDDYVLQMAPSLKRTLREYSVFVGRPTFLIFRYEDVIFDKNRLLEQVSRFFGWKVDEGLQAHILKWADVRPDQERPTEFVRRVTPGDHKDKLSPQVVTRLTTLFSREMASFGYEN